MAPALAGGFLTTAPPGKFQHAVLIAITLSSTYLVSGRIPCLTHEEREAQSEVSSAQLKW